MQNKDEQTKQIVKAFEDASYASGPMEAKLVLHRVDELKQQMFQEDFYAALCQAALNLISKNLGNYLNWIFEIEPKVAQDPEVLAAAKEYLKTSKASSLGTEEFEKCLTFKITK